MRHLLDAYLSLRRGVGFKLATTGGRLLAFLEYAEACGDTHVRAETAILWAGKARSSHERSVRLGNLIKFARHLNAEDPIHEIPPADVYPYQRKKYPPYIYSPQQIRSILEAAGRLSSRCSSWPDTVRTVIALMAATGLRVGEALRLKIRNYTPAGLMIEETKFNKTRLVSLHSTSRKAMDDYYWRQRSLADEDEPYFVGNNDQAVHYTSLRSSFQRILKELDLSPAPGPREARPTGPRLHDFRHTFAVRALESCPPGRDNVQRHMLALTTYMGHSMVSSTYWYLHMTPHLMGQIAHACEEFLEGGPK